MQIEFVIPGKPFGKQRPRATIRGGHATVYTPKETRSFEQKIAEIARPLFPVPFEGPVRLRIVATFEMPKSWSNKKREQMRGKHHTQKPDRDNIDKLVCDGLNRIAWADDGQAADGRCVKRWGDVSSTFVQIMQIGEAQQ